MEILVEAPTPEDMELNDINQKWEKIMNISIPILASIVLNQGLRIKSDFVFEMSADYALKFAEELYNQTEKRCKEEQKNVKQT